MLLMSIRNHDQCPDLFDQSIIADNKCWWFFLFLIVNCCLHQLTNGILLFLIFTTMMMSNYHLSWDFFTKCLAFIDILWLSEKNFNDICVYKYFYDIMNFWGWVCLKCWKFRLRISIWHLILHIASSDTDHQGGTT